MIKIVKENKLAQFILAGALSLAFFACGENGAYFDEDRGQMSYEIDDLLALRGDDPDEWNCDDDKKLGEQCKNSNPSGVSGNGNPTEAECRSCCETALEDSCGLEPYEEEWYERRTECMNACTGRKDKDKDKELTTDLDGYQWHPRP